MTMKAKLKGVPYSKVILFNVFVIVSSLVTTLIANKDYLTALLGPKTLAYIMLGAALTNSAVNIGLRFITNVPLEHKYQLPDGSATDESAKLPDDSTTAQ